MARKDPSRNIGRKDPSRNMGRKDPSHNKQKSKHKKNPAKSKGTPTKDNSQSSGFHGGSDSSEFLSDNPHVPENAHSQVDKKSSKNKHPTAKHAGSMPDLTADKDVSDSCQDSSSDSADNEDVLLNTDGAIIDVGEMKKKHKRQRKQTVMTQGKKKLAESVITISSTNTAGKESAMDEESVMDEDSAMEDSQNTIDENPIRFNVPSEYKTYKFSGSKQPWLEDVDGKELWLIKAPLDYDMSKLDGKPMTIGGSMVVEKETVDDMSYVWEVHATQSDTLKESNWCAFLPAKRGRRLHPAGPLLGQISLSRNIQPKPAVIPDSEPKLLALPEGLKMRHTPFGIESSRKRKDRRQSKKHKKSRLSSHDT